LNKTDKAEKLLVRPSEIAVMYSVSRGKIYELLANGTLPCVRIGGMLRVPVEAVRKLAQVKSDDELSTLPERSGER
jgi:excisionase family DNA binding protein